MTLSVADQGATGTLGACTEVRDSGRKLAFSELGGSSTNINQQEGLGFGAFRNRIDLEASPR